MRHISSRIDYLKDSVLKENVEDKKEESKLSQEFNKYKWMILGAAMAIGWIIGNVNLSAIDGLLK
jgi:hypothetical protein